MNRRKKERIARGVVITGILIFCVGFYIQHELERHGIWQVFASRQQGWRDDAFLAAFWLVVVGIILFVLIKVRK